MWTPTHVRVWTAPKHHWPWDVRLWAGSARLTLNRLVSSFLACSSPPSLHRASLGSEEMTFKVGSSKTTRKETIHWRKSHKHHPKLSESLWSGCITQVINSHHCHQSPAATGVRPLPRSRISDAPWWALVTENTGMKATKGNWSQIDKIDLFIQKVRIYLHR